MIQPITGLTSLGNAIADAGQTYAQNARQDEIDSRNRARVLEDVQSQRAYDAARDKRVADLQFDQERRMANAQMEQAFRKEMIARGYLDYSDRANEGAVAVAHENFKRDGLLEKFNKAISRGLIQVADVGDRAKTDAGLQAMANQDARLLTEDVEAKRRTRQGGQAAAERALQSETELNAQIDRLSAELRDPVPPVSASDVSIRARELWMQNHPSETIAPTAPEKLGPEIQQATKDLREARLYAAKERHDQVQQEIYLLRQQIVAQTQETGRLGQQGFFADPSSTAPVLHRVPNSPLKSGQPFKSGGLELVAPALDELLRHGTPSARGSGALLLNEPVTPPSPIASPVRMAPVTSVKGLLQRTPSAADMAMAPANILAAPGRLIDTAGRYVTAGAQGLYDGNFSVPEKGLIQSMGEGIGDQVSGATMAPNGKSLFGPDNPGAQADIDRLASLIQWLSHSPEAGTDLKKKANAESEVMALRSPLQGAVPAGATRPVVSTPTTSVPAASFGPEPSAWWKSQQPVPAGM